MSALSLPRGLSLLRRFVETSGWHTTGTGLMQAVPHLTEKVTASDCIAALRNLDLPLSFTTGSTAELTDSDFPALRIADSGDIAILRDRRADKVLVETADTNGGAEWEPVCRTNATFVRIGTPPAERAAPVPATIGNISHGFRKTLIALFFASFVTNMMALATPVLIMVIYDRAIPTSAIELIGALVLAMGAVLLTDFVLRSIRVRAVAHMGAGIEGQLSLALFRKLSAVPMSELRKSDVDQQIARLKQFEGMRELFSGPVFATLLDIPFIFLFIGLLFLISPAIGGTLVLACGTFALAAWLTFGPLTRRNEAAARARTEHQKILFETIQSQRVVQRLGAQDVWAERNRERATASATAAGKARRFQLSCQALGQMIMAVSGVTAVVLGTELAILGDLSFGALVAIMSLVWKSLSPVHALYTNLPQLQGFLKSRRQIDRVLSLQEEFTRGAALSNFKAFRGGVSLSNVSFRYQPVLDPVLSQITLDIEPGECVLVSGPNGSGKTTLLDLLDGLNKPLGGSLKFDGVDMRQIAVDDLRHMIGYARQVPDFFHGTIWQNFQLACPDITREAAHDVLERVGLVQDLRHFPDGLDTRLTEAFRKTLSVSTLQGLSLARCLCRPATVFLFDDPATGLDAHRMAAFTSILREMRGKKTVILSSDHPDHVRLADRIVCLQAGRIVVNDTGDAARRKYAALHAKKADLT